MFSKQQVLFYLVNFFTSNKAIPVQVHETENSFNQVSFWIASDDVIHFPAVLLSCWIILRSIYV